MAEMGVNELTKLLEEKTIALKKQEEKNRELTNLIDGQHITLRELRKDNEALKELSKNGPVNQQILSKIFNNLIDASKQSNESKEKKFTQEEICNFCVHIAARFNLNPEPYIFIPPNSPTRHLSKTTSVRTNSPSSKPKSDHDKHDRPSSHSPKPLKLEGISNIGPIKESGAKSAREYVSKGQTGTDQSEQITIDLLRDKSASFTKKPVHKQHRASQDRVHAQSMADRTPKKSSKTTADELFNQSSGSRPSSTSDSPTKKKTSTSSHESEHQSSKLILKLSIYLDDNFIESISYQPNKNLYKSIQRICHNRTIDFSSLSFKDNLHGEPFDLQPSTSHKDLAHTRTLVMVSNNVSRSPSSIARKLFQSDPVPTTNTSHGSPKKRQPTKISSTPLTLESRDFHQRALLSDSDSKVKTHQQSHESPAKHHTRVMARNQPTRAKTIHHKHDEEEPKSKPVIITSSNPKAVRTQIDFKEISEKTIAAWSLPIRNSHLFGDFCRLAARMSFTDCRTGHTNITYTPPEEGLSILQYARDLLKQIVLALEPKEMLEKLTPLLDSADTAQTDGALWVGSIFQVLGDECLTAKLLMATHQGIITACAGQIKVVFFSNTNQFPKDVQTKDGWKIELKLSDDEIKVSHYRKEVSMISSDNSFSFDWTFCLYLKDFKSIDRITLLAGHLEVGNKCDSVLKYKYEECIKQVKSL